VVSQHFVELTLTAAGTVEAFDASGFKASLAASVGVTPADITLDVAAASIRVVATIRVAAAASASGVASTLQVAAADPSALSELVGVTVLSAAAPVVLVRLVAVAPPPTLPPASEDLETSAEQVDLGGQEIEGTVLLAIAVGVGVPLGGLLLCGALMAAYVWRRPSCGVGAARWKACRQHTTVGATRKAAVRGADGNEHSLHRKGVGASTRTFASEDGKGGVARQDASPGHSPLPSPPTNSGVGYYL